MKKTISILLAICIIFSALSVSTYASYTTEEIALNFDYNKDGVVNLSDARAVLRVLANIEEPQDGLIYDLTGDGDGLTIEDVKKVIGIVTGVDTDVSHCAEFNFNLFKAELNSVKTTKPGLTKIETVQCHSMRVTTKNAPVDDLNVTNMDFKEYTNKSCDYMENLLNGAAGLLIPSADKKEMRAYIAELRKQADEVYDLKTSDPVTIKKYAAHYYHFPINNLATSCLLNYDDIKSITCEEKDGYIVRTVLMNEETKIGDDYPTGGGAAIAERREEVAYARVFNVPRFDEKEGSKETSILNKVTFKDGKIVSTIDKLSGIPIKVEYSYSYVADVSTIPEVDENGKEGIQMDTVTSATNTESYDINPVTKN